MSSDFHEAMNLNFYSVLNPILSFIKFFKYTPEKSNNIIVFGATASLRGSKNCSSFAVPKSALRYLCQSLAKEEGERGLHVSHLLVDGLIDNDRTRSLNVDLDEEKYIKMKSIVELIFYLTSQPKDAWTFELDLRCHNEKF